MIRKCYEATVICEDAKIEDEWKHGLIVKDGGGKRVEGSQAPRTECCRNHSQVSLRLTQNRTNTSTYLHASVPLWHH